MSKAKETTTAEWVERVQRQAYYSEGKWFSGPFMHKRMLEANASTTTVNRVLERMVDLGLLDKESRSRGGSTTMWYIRRRTGSNPIRMRWRKRSNKKIGITESLQFGSPV